MRVTIFFKVRDTPESPPLPQCLVLGLEEWKGVEGSKLYHL